MQGTEVNPGAVWLEWGGLLGAAGAGLFLALLAGACGWFWWRQLSGMPSGRRGVLAALRVAAVALVAFLLFRPALVRPVYDKSANVVAVLFDDSASMRVKDGAGLSRADRLRQALDRNAREFDTALASRFHVLDYRFGERARPLENRKHLGFEGKETRILDSIGQVVRDTETLSVSALIVLSDGGQQLPVKEADWALLRGAGIPVYTVGIGESGWRDLSIGDVALGRSFFDGAPARITAQFSAAGLAGHTIVVDVVGDGAVQASEEREIAGDFAEQQVQLEVVPRARQWLDYTVRVRFKTLADTGAPLDFVPENNEASVLFDYREKSYRILYFSGRPNWQNKFVRHALAADPELHLSSLIRISGAEKRFEFKGEDTSLGNPLFEGFKEESALPRYDEAVFTRLGLAEGELKDGYPTLPEGLYPFHLIIWGDVEADFFAPAHLRLTRDAVAERGASFLMLGGPRSLAAGGYSGTEIESMLPLMPGAVTPYDGAGGDPVAVEASPEGFLTGVWALAADAEASALAWRELPGLPGADAVGAVRIGASTMAYADLPGSGNMDGESPFLVWQTFGRGKSAVLATGETWPWHMRTEDGNDVHERLWRQMVRSLVSTVPDPVTLEVEPDVLVEGSEGKLAWRVKDNLFEDIVGASLRARVIDPNGAATVVPLVERLDTPGAYEGLVTPALPGRHQVVLEGADAGGQALAAVESAVLVRSDTREVDNARFDAGLLERIAAETGGAYFPLASLGEVAGAVAPSERTYTRLDRKPIWHHPAFYASLVALLCFEWTLRRRWGQA